MLKKTVLCLICLCLIQACASKRILPEAKSSTPVKGFISCTKPYNLTKGCNKTWIAAFTALIDKNNFSFSSTEDGKVVYITEPFSSSMAKGHVTGRTLGLIDLQTKALNSDVKKIEEVFNNKGINIIEVRPQVMWIITYTTVYGYFLILDGNGYDVLSKYIVE